MTNERRKEIRKKRKAKNKNRFVEWFKSLSKKKKAALIVAVVILLLMILLVGVVAWKFSKLDTQEIPEEEIIVNELAEEVGVGYTNFVLFGGDSRSGNVDGDLNTDSIIIVSLNNETKEVKLVSLYRDTLLDLTNGSIKKCNGAYAAGGAKQAINMLNMNLDLDIKKYVTVDFGAVSELVDMLGGIEADISEAEMNAMNKYIGETATVAGKKAKLITKTGLQTLDGVQATTYARIRKGVGDDYKRTERQRYVIQKVVEKALKSDLATINKIVDELFPRISTNFTMGEILSYAKSFAKYSIGETTGFPIEKGSGTIPGKGSCVFPITLEKNVTLLHEFLYGTVDYQPSAKVVSISNEIAYLIGNREVEPNTTWVDNGGSTAEPETPSTGSGNIDDGSESGTGSESGSGTGSEGGTGTGSEGGSGTGSEGGSGTGSEGGSGTGSEGGSGTGSEGGSGTGSEGGSGTGSGGGSGTGSGGGSGTGSEGGSGTGSESGSTTTPDSGQESSDSTM